MPMYVTNQLQSPELLRHVGKCLYLRSGGFINLVVTATWRLDCTLLMLDVATAPVRLPVSHRNRHVLALFTSLVSSA